MKEWFKEHWFVVKSYLWSALCQIVFLAIWDWQVPHTTWGYNLPFFVKYFPAALVFVIAHSVQVMWHVWRKSRRAVKPKTVTGS